MQPASSKASGEAAFNGSLLHALDRKEHEQSMPGAGASEKFGWEVCFL